MKLTHALSLMQHVDGVEPSGGVGQRGDVVPLHHCILAHPHERPPRQQPHQLGHLHGHVLRLLLVRYGSLFLLFLLLLFPLMKINA